MPRIPYPDISTLPETMRRMLAGTPLNVVRIGAHASPALFEAQGKLGFAVADPAVLAPRIRETAILRVAFLSESSYELHHHIPLARAAGLTPADIQAIEAKTLRRARSIARGDLPLHDEVVLLITPSDATLAALRAQVSDQIMVNLILDNRLLYVDRPSDRRHRD